MHHVILERWSRRQSFLHSRDPRVKIAALLVFLLLVATTRSTAYVAYAGYAILLLATLAAARLPMVPLLLRAGLVLPFSIVFALVSWASGDFDRAISLILRSCLSATAVLILVSSTRLPDLLRALSWFRVPGLLILIAQFLYRYLFVLSEQAQHMRLAASCRTGPTPSRNARQSRFSAATGALAVLFTRSYQRADGIHRAMLSRGFQGRFPALGATAFRVGDFVFLVMAVVALVVVRLVVAS